MARQPSAWNKHVSATKRANPKMGFSNVLKVAAKSYKKK